MAFGRIAGVKNALFVVENCFLHFLGLERYLDGIQGVWFSKKPLEVGKIHGEFCSFFYKQEL